MSSEAVYERDWECCGLCDTRQPKRNLKEHGGLLICTDREWCHRQIKALRRQSRAVVDESGAEGMR